MINNSLVCGAILIVLSIQVNAQNVKKHSIQEIETRSELWNKAYNSRDSLRFYTLFDSLAVLSSAGGRWIGAEECKRLCRGLYKRRPDISWTNKSNKIEINEQWNVAYETGDWTEAWTEQGDTSKSQIIGKYWIMWRFKNDNWYIISGIFTPLSCTGSYCNKKK
ncbi:YybH family protein [Solitalea canadensis]|uniref:DUF4440 domain-containing protein n=1 Tax=Solitalea canadensis (strain ATCC 29591 / DSM 3403 / JCM 21819 / LMG 8368 / NBRC 15130 / NCIMB 12057 / USAM 9D) TaxID=929556 RepID=H8KLC4_SOLCM|nr:nuclear transport factor 2 family protein [Solitalea canadensis]AFD08626.1 hypothetical protein Solca_3622 [Solitalea canadensis DSM 3403]